MQSDKASVDITSRFDGIITKLHYKQNETAKVGQPLLSIDVADENSIQDAIPSVAPKQEGSEKAKDHSNKPQSKETNAPILPSVRLLAQEMGIDLNLVIGTGNRGQVTKEDMEKFVNDKKSKMRPTNSLEYKVIRLSAYQKAMVKSMEKALDIPHFGYSDEIDVGLLDELRKQAKKDTKLTFLPFMLKSISEAIKKYPIINSHFEGGELKTFSSHNICVAIDSPQGLVVPVIKNVEKKSILDLAKELIELEALARENKLAKEQLSEGTISISNIGSIGGIYANPVLLSPQVCIGAVGRARILPRYGQDGALSPFKILNISWSADHRVLDGATIARFSNAVKEQLQNPKNLLN